MSGISKSEVPKLCGEIAEKASVRLVGAILLEENDEWAVRRVQRGRSMTMETIAPLSDDPTVSLPAIAK